MSNTTYIDKEIEKLQQQKIILESKDKYFSELNEFYKQSVGKCYRSALHNLCNDGYYTFIRIDSFHASFNGNEKNPFEVSVRGAFCRINISPCMTIGRVNFDPRGSYSDSFAYEKWGTDEFKVKTEGSYGKILASTMPYVKFKETKKNLKNKELEGEAPHT